MTDDERTRLCQLLAEAFDPILRRYARCHPRAPVSAWALAEVAVDAMIKLGPPLAAA